MIPTSLANSTELNSSDAQLIWELVSDISAPSDVLARHGLDKAGLQRKLRNPMFRSAFNETKRLWNADLNVNERIRIKAALMLEDSLPDIYKIIKDDSQPSAAKLEAVEKLGKLSQTMAPKKEGQMGERHTITINVGDKPITIEHMTQPAIEGEAA